MTNKTTENDYHDMLVNTEITPEMEVIFNDVLTMIDSRMAALQTSAKVTLGMKIAATITATTLANALHTDRHLLNPAIEALAEDIHTMTEETFKAFDNGAFTTH